MTRQEMREAIRPLMSEERYRHSLGVEKEAERLARRWGEDPEKAAIAGILHDCCKEMPLPEALQIMRRSAIMTEIDFREQPQLIHGFAAAEILGRYGVRDKDIENAVRYHTTGRAGMSRLEKIVYLADLTEEGRGRDAPLGRSLPGWGDAVRAVLYHRQAVPPEKPPLPGKLAGLQ